MYDWANSVYSLVIKSSIFPVFYNTATLKAFDGEIVNFFGFKLINTALYSFAIAFSFLVIAILSPFLSGIADYTDSKKSFMKFFTYMGALSCMGLFFFTGRNIEWAMICSIFASIGYTGSLVFYNSFLPVITTPDQFDRVSAKGFSLGYVGSLILLIINLVCISNPSWFGLVQTGIIARISFLTVGLWWLGFAQITFRGLKAEKGRPLRNEHWLLKGYKELLNVVKLVRQMPVLKTYLVSFFFYSMGVQTVMYMAASFGSKELNLPGPKLIMTVLIINAVAIAGAYFFAWYSKKYSNKASLLFMLIIWVGICIYAYFVYTDYQFYILAFVVGLVMGGIQSLSRSTYSKLIPRETHDHASFFSFYDVTEKIAVVIGTLSYGLIEELTGSMRNSTIALGFFFLIGIIILSFAKLNEKTNTKVITG
jgi:UMF1 family MFS transporter